MYTPRSTKGNEYFNVLMQRKYELKEAQTNAEYKLWFHLRNNKLGFKFKRQHLVYNFIADFYCVEKCLVIEVDGGVHLTTKVRDDERDSALNCLGIKVIRFTNEQIEKDIYNCVDSIKDTLN